MKANELRIGNYLIELGEVFQVWEIGLFDEDIRINDSSYNHRVEPIPLTEEWLLKFGFTKNQHKTEIWFSGNDMAIELISGWFRDRSTGTILNSVHWLQNYYFFKIGKELEIK